jgi:orotidine-5'-phosphate decarboxylase
MTLTFAERLARAQLASGGLLCVGLDPDPAKLPRDLGQAGGGPPLLAFNRRIVDATADLAAAYKPQIAFYSALGAEDELLASIRYIRERAPAALVILDAKRNDIGNTAEAYAREAFDRYDADAVTVNPYMGEDSVRPFLARPDRGAVLLCRTSNSGAKDFQDLLIDGLPLYRRVAERAAGHWNEHRNLMLVVGATYHLRGRRRIRRNSGGSRGSQDGDQSPPPGRPARGAPGECGLAHSNQNALLIVPPSTRKAAPLVADASGLAT